MDRQPSGASSVSSPTGVTSGLTRWPTSPSTNQVNTRSPTPSCGAASPAPPAANMVSVEVGDELPQLGVEVDDRRGGRPQHGVAEQPDGGDAHPTIVGGAVGPSAARSS